jgi:hypothetical protein
MKKAENEFVIPPIGSICMLCQKAPPIQNSHILPKFAINWLKTISSGFVRSATEPNLRKQDLPTYPLLCLKCEGRFSVWEDQFARHIFLPYQENPTDRIFHYNRWLIYFLVSISWRVLAIELERLTSEEPFLIRESAQAFERWRKFLMGESMKINPYEHRLFFFSAIEIESAPPSLPDKFNAYTMRCFDCSVVSTDTWNRVYALIPGIAFWSTITPPKCKGWPRSSNIVRKGTIATSQRVSDTSFGDFIQYRATAAFEKDLSDRQKKVVSGSMTKRLQNQTKEQIWKIMEPHFVDNYLRKARQQNRARL